MPSGQIGRLRKRGLAGGDHPATAQSRKAGIGDEAGLWLAVKGDIDGPVQRLDPHRFPQTIEGQTLQQHGVRAGFHIQNQAFRDPPDEKVRKQTALGRQKGAMDRCAGRQAHRVLGVQTGKPFRSGLAAQPDQGSINQSDDF